MLTDETDTRFRHAMKQKEFMTALDTQQSYHWQTFLNNRLQVPITTEEDTTASSHSNGSGDATDVVMTLPN